jgi:LacI family transcriptional regulator
LEEICVADQAKLAASRRAAQRVTLRTVAKSLGLSVTTVSRALKDGPEVNRETIDLVKKAASDLGYRPNLGGINLRTGKTHAVGVIMPFHREGEMNIVVASLIEGFCGAMKQHGYRTTVAPQFQADDPLTTVRDLVEEGTVDGLILTHTRPQDDRVKYLLEVGMPFVTFGRTELLSKHPSIDIDHEEIGTAAAARLLNAGHKAPLLVAPSSQFTYSLQFIKGWTAEFNRRNLTVPDERMFFTATTPDSGKKIAVDALAKYPQVTSAFVASDEAALGFVSALADFGRKVGEDFSILTYSGSRLHDFYNPPLSTYYFPNFIIGQRLSDLLYRSMQGEPASGLIEIVRASFVERRSEFSLR